jgi:hypothetical protein
MARTFHPPLGAVLPTHWGSHYGGSESPDDPRGDPPATTLCAVWVLVLANQPQTGRSRHAALWLGYRRFR